MIGQKNLINSLQSIPFDNFPHTLLLEGPQGSGKHTLIRKILAPHLKLDVIDISDKISFDYILEIQLRAVPAIYLINLGELNERLQNVILKFIEEPMPNSFIVLITENVGNILDTIKNRCMIHTLEPYTKEELATFICEDCQSVQELILQTSETPGQVLAISPTGIVELYDLCDKIVTKLEKANFANTLTIADKINYKDDYDKFDIGVFFNALITTVFKNLVDRPSKQIKDLYDITADYKSKLTDTRLNKQMLVESYLTTIWKAARA